MRLILGRHGKAAHNVAFERYQRGTARASSGMPDPDVPLVHVGVLQARAAGAYLHRHRIVPDLVCLSPTARTRQTWAEYGFPAHTPLEEPRLREQAGGIFDRLPLSATRAQREVYAREAKRSLDARPPGGESIREHLERVEEWLRETMTLYPAVTVLALTHYGTIGLLGLLCEGLRVEEYLARRPEHLTPGYGSLLGYERDERGWRRLFLFRNPHDSQ